MSNDFLPPVLDAHVDFLGACEVEQRDFLEESDEGHVDLPRARAGGLGGLLASIYLRPSYAESNPLQYMMKYADDALRLVDRADGQIALIRTADELDACFEGGRFAFVLHLEGAEPVSKSLKELRPLYELGVRSIGIVHARTNMFGSGVPIPWSPTGVIHGLPQSVHDYGLRNRRPQPFPATGLTELGREFVYECQRLGIAVDVSHLTEDGFWDTVDTATRPVIASHSSAHAVAPHPRNLTDKQLRALAGKGGVVGINFFVCFIRPDGARDPDTPLEQVLAHIDHVVNVVGDEHVGIGTDFDGAVMPTCVGDARKMADVVRAMSTQLKYSNERIERICNGNFRRVLRDCWNDGPAKAVTT
ncbi:MAG: dipeptidase [bacterium]|jgi:membrane dipeptidase|nr:dipeptidase [bacterium]